LVDPGGVNDESFNPAAWTGILKASVRQLAHLWLAETNAKLFEEKMETNIVLQTAVPRKWYAIWWDVWRHPGVKVFQDLLQGENVNSSRGFTWIALTGLIVGVVNLSSSLLLQRNAQSNIFDTSDISYLLCGGIFSVPLTPILYMVGLAISAWIYHTIAKLFHGTGNWENLAFCFAAVEAPYLLFSSVNSILNSLLPSVSMDIFVMIYTSILYINAIKAVEHLSTGAAVGTYLTLVITILILAVAYVAIFEV
jgi:hypothetical protein